MPQFQSTRHVAHSAQDMFDLVADVERYAEFLPYCLSCSVLRRTTAPDGRLILLAQMTVGYGPVRESFVSRVMPDAEQMRILVQYVDGPFKKLENRWAFRSTGDAACDVDFYIDYTFKSRAFEILAGSIFDRLFRKMSEAFVERANTLAQTANRVGKIGT